MLRKSLLKDIKNKIAKLNINNYKKAGLNWFDVQKIKSFSTGDIFSYKLFDSVIFFKSGTELLHSINEIFIEEIYKVRLIETPFIVDCGSNIGMSVLYFKKQFPAATVIAFEPDTQNFELLSCNIKSYNLQNVELHNEAVWIKDTYLNFFNDNSMSSHITATVESEHTTIKVKAVRLLDFLKKPVDFLKIDIEGAEYSVLKDIESKLYLVQNMFFEYHGSFQQQSELTNIFNLLDRTNFYYYTREAAPIYKTPFYRKEKSMYDVQLNIFCFKKLV